MSRATRVLPVDPSRIGQIVLSETSDFPLDQWRLRLFDENQDAAYLLEAADALRNSDVPVAFPTETVYGLGADATRSSAVKGIYAAKQRPSDNPLIVHISSLQQLRGLLRPNGDRDVPLLNGHSEQIAINGTSAALPSGQSKSEADRADPIPAIYKPLIQRFWPGPLTLIMPKPDNSVLATEVTAGLNTFGARMPRSLLALALIKLAGVPVAAPSANASTKPSPTAAEHVLHDLEGRIDLIVDGGPCDVGVESTVVDGLSSPPSVLRPGGISIDQLRQCPGWENTVIGYKDASEQGMQPKAPGMKYRHYSPKATVVLYEVGAQQPTLDDMLKRVSDPRAIGVIRTRTWAHSLGVQDKAISPLVEERVRGDSMPALVLQVETKSTNGIQQESFDNQSAIFSLSNLSTSLAQHQKPRARKTTATWNANESVDIWTVDLGSDIEGIARGLFSALRELDLKNVQAIFVEGIDDNEGYVAAAVMNRLRKAAEVNIHG